MKKILKYILMPAVAMMVWSCEDFLEPTQYSIVTDEFYDTKEGQEALLVDIYQLYRGIYTTPQLQFYGTDIYTAVTAGPEELQFNGYDKTFNSTASVVGTYWTTLYKIVQESNTLLARISPDEEGMTESEYNSITAQTRFLRSLAYYYLVETFGPVPFYTDENKEIITDVTREPETTIYDFIIGDLQSITKEMLPYRADEAGRVSYSAVLQLLGKLYLTRAYKPFAQIDDFSNAAAAFEEIISGSGHRLLASYADVFDENNQNNDEIIWAIQYGTDKQYYGSGNPQQSWFGFNITAKNPEMFITGAQSDYSSMQRQYWIDPCAHEFFTDPIADARYDAAFQREFYINNPENANFGKLGIYFPRWNDNSGDSKGAAIFVPFKNNGNYYWYAQDAGLGESVLANASDYMPMLCKFKDTKMDWGGAGTREDVVMRLGDTYLLCAEAYLGAGETGRALGKVNAIRTRAASAQHYIATMQLAAFDLETLMDERARELLGEHDRWFDLKRCGLLIERAKRYNLYVQHCNNINSDYLVRPIPQVEIDRSKGLSQNEGY